MIIFGNEFAKTKRRLAAVSDKNMPLNLRHKANILSLAILNHYLFLNNL